jgi:hypothetical protein
MSGPESKARKRLDAEMQRAMLTKVANEFRARYEPADGMPPEIVALLKELDQSQMSAAPPIRVPSMSGFALMPACPKCSSSMELKLSMPGGNGGEERHFLCLQCEHSQIYIVES